jgi:hypothetical protein
MCTAEQFEVTDIGHVCERFGHQCDVVTRLKSDAQTVNIGDVTEGKRFDDAEVVSDEMKPTQRTK